MEQEKGWERRGCLPACGLVPQRARAAAPGLEQPRGPHSPVPSVLKIPWKYVLSLHVTASGGLAGRKKITTSANERFLRAPPGLGLPSRPAAEPSSAGPGAPSSPALWGRSPPGARGRFQPLPAGFGFQPSRASHHLQQCSLRHVHNHRLAGWKLLVTPCWSLQLAPTLPPTASASAAYLSWMVLSVSLQ